MVVHELSRWRHEHVFDPGNRVAERGARAVMGITLAVMVLEIAAGGWFNSMALLADGWHMSTHALALGLSAFAYAAARRYARDSRFAFGTWKIEILAGYTSAVLLVGVAVMMIVGSLERLLAPRPIHYQEAMAVAGVGLAVNLVCAFILGGAHPHGDSGPAHDHTHHDLNLKSAYVHVVADAATSVLALLALAGGWLYGWAWLDPLMGIIGAGLILFWAYGLTVETARILLDREMDHGVVEEIRQAIATEFSEEEARLTDLHVWRVGNAAYAAALAVVTHDPTFTADRLKAALRRHEELAHLTVEINRCDQRHPESAAAQ